MTTAMLSRPSGTRRKRETAHPEIARVMRARRRGEKMSESHPQKGLPSEPSSELRLSAPAAIAGDMPTSRRYGTIWKLMVPDIRMTRASAMMMSQNADVRAAWPAVQSEFSDAGD